MFKINERILGPELGSQLFTLHQLRGMFEQHLQNFQRLPEKPNCASVLAKLLRARIKLKRAKALLQGRFRYFCHDLPELARSLTFQSGLGKESVRASRPLY